LPQSTRIVRASLEDDFQAFAARYNLPKPLVNTVVNGREVDVLFPEHKVIVEVDGWETHRTRRAFEDDRDRDAEQLMAGFVTVRITSDRMQTAPSREAARLQAILDSRAQTLTDL
jgi:very-short-patch-repair endonuclease